MIHVDLHLACGHSYGSLQQTLHCIWATQTNSPGSPQVVLLPLGPNLDAKCSTSLITYLLDNIYVKIST